MVALTPSRTAAPLAPKIVSLPWCTICLLSQASAKDGKFFITGSLLSRFPAQVYPLHLLREVERLSIQGRILHYYE